jgi:hypothetical protein
MEVAAAVLDEVGQCTAARVPYRNVRCDNDLGNIALDTARAEAASYRLSTTKLNPADVDAMAALIQRGWPVAVLLTVYVGWDSEEVWRTGEVTMPPSSTIDTYHAVCLVGYNVNPAMPFPRGRFLFRNSWGTEFGRDLRLGATPIGGEGNGILPFEYLTQGHCTAAYVASNALR